MVNRSVRNGREQTHGGVVGSTAGDVRGGCVGSWAMIVRSTLRFGRALGRSGRACVAVCRVTARQAAVRATPTSNFYSPRRLTYLETRKSRNTDANTKTAPNVNRTRTNSDKIGLLPHASQPINRDKSFAPPLSFIGDGCGRNTSLWRKDLATPLSHFCQ